MDLLLILLLLTPLNKSQAQYLLEIGSSLQETPPWPSGPLTKTSPEKMWGREMPGPGGQRI